MFKTDVRLARFISASLLALSAVFPLTGHAQTIAEVAERQRAKLLADANPAQPATAAPPSAPKASSKAKQAPSVTWRLHGIFGIGDHISADVLKGDQLQRVHAGSTIGHYKVVEISLFAMKLQTEKGCGRKCPSHRTVALGGTF